jgi:hypothetical protein
MKISIKKILLSLVIISATFVTLGFTQRNNVPDSLKFNYHDIVGIGGYHYKSIGSHIRISAEVLEEDTFLCGYTKLWGG